MAGESVVTSEYIVTGMTCGHCAKAVSDELGGLSGVQAVDVDVATGRVTVRSDQPLDLDAVRGAVDEAGYQLVEP